jgi:hypothetical protein
LWGIFYKGRSVSNCREHENMFLPPGMKKSLPSECFLKSGLISSACTVEIIYEVIFSWTCGIYPHSGFHYSKLLTLVILVALAIFLTWVCIGVGIDWFLIDFGFRNFFNTKITWFGSVLNLADCLCCCITVTD